ncbi:MAG: hypothetical protein RJS97_22725 [Parvibaculaceae bacterium]
MAKYDTIIKDGTIIDGTGTSRFFDIGISQGVIERIGGNIPSDQAGTIIEAGGNIIAPGAFDPHAHYDTQVHWDPYCTNSGWYGTTTVAVGNCGFGFMPCRPEDRDQYMRMMDGVCCDPR